MSEAAKKIEPPTVLVAPLNGTAFRQYEHECQTWFVYADPKATDDHLTDPKYWANVANLFRAPAELTIMAEDGTWKRKATVLAADRNWAKVVIDQTYFYAKQTVEPKDPDMTVEWAGPQHKWRVIRTDGEVLSKEHQTRDQAEVWMKSHREALSR